MKEPTPQQPGRYRLGSDTFRFACNEEIPCFTRCCQNADMLLYPYDIIRLKKHLGMTSEEFLVTHTITAFRDNPNFPSIMLKMSDDEGHPCSFLSDKGCTVYENRPYSCRAYPLEPAMQDNGKGGFSITSYVVQHDHCLGHGEGKDWTSEAWMKSQGMETYNKYNSAWAKVASLLFSPNAFGEQGADNPAMNMAYMASYNVDTFRRFVKESSFLKKYKVPKKRLTQIKRDDAALMLLGFDWIRRFLRGQGPLQEKKKR